jgi:hypothetical protein
MYCECSQDINNECDGSGQGRQRRGSSRCDGMVEQKREGAALPGVGRNVLTVAV